MRRTSQVLAAAIAIALAFAVLPLAGCGGGGGAAPRGTDPTVVDLPQDPGGPDLPLPDDPPPPPDDPPAGDPPADDPPADDPPADDPPSDPPAPPPGDPTPPPPPDALPAFSNLPALHALARDPIQGTVWAVAVADGALYRLGESDPEPHAMGTLGIADVRGLAFDPVAGTLYAVADDPNGPDDRLLRVVPETLEVLPVGPIAGYGAVEGLAWHAALDRLYAVDATAGVLLRLDAATAEATVVGAPGTLTNVTGLAADPGQPRLFATDAAARALLGVDAETGAVTRLADTDDVAVQGLAFDARTQRFWIATTAPDALRMWDPIGAWMHHADITGLAYDTARERVVGTYPPNGLLVTIDRETGWKRAIGYAPVPGLDALAYDAGRDRFLAVSRTLQALYVLSPEDASVESSLPLVGPAAPFTGLAGLAFDGAMLYATDDVSSALLRIEPTTGNTVVLSSLAAWPRIEGLAYDATKGLLHAHANATRTHLAIDPAAPANPTVMAQGAFDTLCGLAWAPAAETLYGSDAVSDALVVVLAPVPSPLGFDDLRALARRGDTGQLMAFDGATDTLLEIDPVLGIGLPLWTWEGSALEAMTYDPETGVLLVADAASGNLYALDAEGTATRIGEEGVLTGFALTALAYQEQSGRLYGVDDATDHLVEIDRATGVATPVDATGPGLAFATVEALVDEPGTPMLLGLDRETRTLLHIDPMTGNAVPAATVAATTVRGMAVAAGGSVLLLADGDRLVAVDPVSGDAVGLPPVFAVDRSAGTAALPCLLWPRGEIGADALESVALELPPTHEGLLAIEFLAEGRVLGRTTFEPEETLARAAIPAAVREAIVAGRPVTWRAAGQSASFQVVDADVAHAWIERVLAHPTMRERDAFERRLVRAFLLDRYRLHSEALRVGLETFLAWPERQASAHALLRTLRHLGLEDSVLGARARAVALTPVAAN